MVLVAVFSDAVSFVSGILAVKDTTNRLADGSYQVPSAEHIFKDYQFSTDQKVALPEA